jgi:acyl transferase domain-containing protein/acyl carrier protein/short-subunit dehydrogenase
LAGAAVASTRAYWRTKVEPLAIIGLGCRFPGGADNPEGFWELLRNGVDAVTDVPADRWDSRRFFDQDPTKPGKMSVRQGGFLKRPLDHFDAQFFGMSPREAASLDPQQRLLLEVAWEALEEGGLPPERLAGSDTGVFIGAFTMDHLLTHMAPSNRHLLDIHGYGGGTLALLANRISHAFGFRGPSVTLDTACSSSLVAVHYACQALWGGECGLAVAGGVSVMFRPEYTIALTKGRVLSPDARCKTFDERANGYARGEGAGVVVLKRLSAALADGDPVHALVRATAVNQDGHTTALWVPSRQAQEALLREALRRGDIAPPNVHYVEAHGTGTAVGDPIEANALGSVLGVGRDASNPCLIGSVKTNIGHLEAAAGVAGLIKAVLCLERRQIPPHLHLQRPNPKIDFDALHLRVPQRLEPWPETPGPAYAGVNSFGYGGTNAHVVLQEAPRLPPGPEDLTGGCPDRAQLLPLSARSEAALRAVAQAFLDLPAFQGPEPSATLHDLCYSASVRRGHHDHRLALVVRSHEELRAGLRAFLAGELPPGLCAGHAPLGRKPRVVFVLTGMGPQWPGMGRGLLEEEPVFRAAIERTDSLFRRYGDWSLLEELAADEAHSRMARAEVAQTTNFALQAALTDLWRSWGVEPAAVVGHSVGEVAAAYAAGALDLDDAMRVSFYRSQMQARAAGQGGMLAVGLSPEETERLLDGYQGRVAIAAVNSPTAVTLSGDAGALDEVARELTARNIFNRFLHVEVAYHSHHMDPFQDELRASLRGLRPRRPTVPFYSTVTGQRVDGAELTADYWWRNVREPVRFASALDQLLEEGHDLFLHVGPHPVLSASITECLRYRRRPGTVLASLRRHESERPVLLETLGRLYSLGYPLDWRGLYPRGGRFLRLPAYPWQREHHWIESAESKEDRLGSGGHPLLGGRLKSPQPSWEVELNHPSFPYLADHRVEGAVVFPGAGYVEMGLAIGQETAGPGPCVLEEIEFHKALLVSDGAPPLLHLSIGHEQGRFAVHSRTRAESASWVLHATGKLLERRAVGAPRRAPLGEIRSRCAEEIRVEDLYAQLKERGLEYGTCFRGVQRLWRGNDEVLSEIQVPPALETSLASYRLHPAVLDAGFQALLAALPAGGQSAGHRGVYLPVRVEQVRFYGSPGPRLWGHGRITRRTAKHVEGDVSLCDDAGDVLVEVRGLRCRALAGRPGDDPERWQDWLYESRWRPQARPGGSEYSPPDFLPSPRQIAERLYPQLDGLSIRHELRRGDELTRRLDALGLIHIVHVLRRLGWDFRPREQFTPAAMAERIGVASRHRRLFGLLLEVLRDAGVVKKGGPAWETIQVPPTVRPPDVWQELAAQYPASRGELVLAERCWSRFGELLRGDCDPLQVVFPGGDLTAAERIVQESPSSVFYGRLACEAIRTASEHLPAGRTVRILEIGAGTGGTAAHVLPGLPAGRTEYVFTDVSSLFTNKARDKFRDRPFLRYQLLDIERDPEAQGFAPHQFDVILAANVLHATSDLRLTLRHVQRLLAPGGLLAVVELLVPRRVNDLTFGWLEGWWKFTDTDLRPSYPLMPRHKWCALLAEAGFTEPVAISQTDVTEEEPNQSLFLASGPRVGLEPGASKVPSAAPRPRGRHLIFADEAGFGRGLAEHLARQGESPVLVFPGSAYERDAGQRFRVCPARPEEMRRLVEAVGAEAACRSVVYLWGLDALLPGGPAALSARQSGLEDCASVAYLIQALAQAGCNPAPRLWLVTRGAQRVGEGDRPHSLAQATLWGLGRSAANEHPDLRCSLVDLDPADLPSGTASLCEELLADGTEHEVAFRGGARYVHRVAQVRPEPREVPCRLEITRRGNLDSLRFRECRRRKPGAGEVEIRVRAAGLNFKDILKGMGVLSERVSEGTMSGESLGAECSGTVAQVGEGVEHPKVGEDVIAWAHGCFGTFVTAPATQVLPKLPALTFEQAAAVPLAFLTAYYALHEVARLERGERVLIHAATGGVGLAAIQVARRAGADIFATAGTPEKRAFLHSLGIAHVADSRSLDFGDKVMEWTDGRGVNVVLNSLTGEALTKSLALLAPYGRFIEIGKRDIDENKPLPLRPFNHNLAFMAIDVDRLISERPHFALRIMREIHQRLQEGAFSPPPLTVFPAAAAGDAFRHLAQAKHVGKVVLSLGEPELPAALPGDGAGIRPDGSYLITGGLRGVGLEAAKWLAERGARHLVLVGRSGAASPEAREAVEALERQGVQITVARADVSREAQVAGLLSDVARTMPPLRGILHAAMVLDDGLLVQLDRDRFEKVMAPKVLGAWNLHAHTLRAPLDFFVLFSSLSGLGNRGQANYSAANAFLEALAHYRRSRGLPALCINWGILAGAGFVARNDKLARHLEQQGHRGIPVREALDVLGRLLGRKATHVAVADLNWPLWARSNPASTTSPRFSELGLAAPESQAMQDGVPPEAVFRNTLLSLEPKERYPVLESRVRETVARVLRLPADSLDVQHSINDLGVDSLMAVELQTLIQSRFGVDFCIMDLMSGPTVGQLSNRLLEELLPSAGAPQEGAPEEPEPLGGAGRPGSSSGRV